MPLAGELRPAAGGNLPGHHSLGVVLGGFGIGREDQVRFPSKVCIDNSYTSGLWFVYLLCIYRERLMRDAAINLRALPEQRDLIDQAAQLLGKNRSDFMLEAACDKAQAVLLDQVFFSLDEAKFREFTALLDAPPAPNPGLDRLMAVKVPWQTGA